MKEKELTIEFKNTKKTRSMQILHIAEIWNDLQFLYIKNCCGDLYTIPITNILYTIRKEKINEGN